MSSWLKKRLRLYPGLVVLVAADLSLLAAWISKRLLFGPATTPASEVTPFIVLAGVLVALWTLASNRRRNASEDYLESAVDLLSKAHDTLDSGKDPTTNVPKNNRLTWLAAARLIRTSEQVAALITEESHMQIWKAQKEYWRGRLYDLIQPSSEGFPSDYYADKPEHMLMYLDDVRAPLSERSLAVLYRFIKWPKDVQDPMEGDASFTAEEAHEMVTFGPRGLGRLIEKVQEMKKK